MEPGRICRCIIGLVALNDLHEAQSRIARAIGHATHPNFVSWCSPSVLHIIGSYVTDASLLLANYSINLNLTVKVALLNPQDNTKRFYSYHNNAQ